MSATASPALTADPRNTASRSSGGGAAKRGVKGFAIGRAKPNGKQTTPPSDKPKGKFASAAGSTARVCAKTGKLICSKTGKVIKRTTFVWPIKALLGLLDVLSGPFSKMMGRDHNFPMLWKVGCAMIIISFWIAVLVHSSAGSILREVGMSPIASGHITLIITILFPGMICLAGVCMILGGMRLQMNRTFMQKYGGALEAIPAFESGVIFRIGDLKMSLRDMHTGVGALGGVGTGKVNKWLSVVSIRGRGEVQTGSVKPGEFILGPYGYREVLKIIPYENHGFWTVRTKCGKETSVGADHLWWHKVEGQAGEAIAETQLLKELMKERTVYLPIMSGDVMEWDELESITFDETSWGRCFVLAGTEHLYIADGIVTHNCLDPDQDLLMYDGSIRKVKEVSSNELLMGPDGKPRRVLATSTGFGPLYRIVPIGGAGKPWVCNDAHILTLKYTSKKGSRPGRKVAAGVVTQDHEERKKHYKGLAQVFGETPSKTERKRQQKMLEEAGYTADVSLKDFIARTPPSRRLDSMWKLFRPKGIEFPNDWDNRAHHEPNHRDWNTDEFYLLGAWIGDGYLDRYAWINEDTEILKSISDYFERDSERALIWKDADPQNPSLKLVWTKKRCTDSSYSQLERLLYQCTTASAKMRAECRGSAGTMGEKYRGLYDKDLPHWVLTAPREKRLSLLAGILDTDGSLDDANRCFDFSQKRKHITEKVVWLCRSLGLAACEATESWKEATNGTKILPTADELRADTALLSEFAERGLRKLGLWLREETKSQAEHDGEVARIQAGLESADEASRREAIEALLEIHRLEKRERYWRTCISGDIEKIPTRVARKQVKTMRPEKRRSWLSLPQFGENHFDTKDPLCFGWDAEPIGEGPYCGFTLDGDGRFLLGDFTVTHNTVALMVPIMRQFFRNLANPDDNSEFAKCGALILDEKGDFIDSTITEMLLAGRSLQDLVLIDPDLDLYRYNPLDPNQSADENAAKLAKVQKILGTASSGDNAYWDQTSQMTIKNFLQLLEVYKPKHKIGLDDVARFMRDDELAKVLCDTVEKTINDRKETGGITEEAYGMYFDAISSTRNAWIELAPNTKSTLKTTITNMLGPIASNPRLQKVFCRDTNFSFKDLPNRGKIVLFRGSGVDKQTAKLICVCLKIDFQTWQKRRNGSAASAYGLNTTRTVVFLCDEYQEFVTCGGEGDETFYGVSRSTRTAPVVATQSYNSLETAIKNKEQTKTLRQNITTWVFFRSTDEDTCKLGEFLAGKSKKEDFSTSQDTTGLMETASNLGGSGGGKGSSISISKKLEEVFRADDFSRLITMTMEKSRTGPWYSEAIVYHYHDVDTAAESRCYKTRLAHLYYPDALRKQSADNVKYLDRMLYDRNWQRKAIQRGLVMVQRANDAVKAQMEAEEGVENSKAKVAGVKASARANVKAGASSPERTRQLEEAQARLAKAREESARLVRQGEEAPGVLRDDDETLGELHEQAQALRVKVNQATSDSAREGLQRQLEMVLLKQNQVRMAERMSGGETEPKRQILRADHNIISEDEVGKEEYNEAGDYIGDARDDDGNRIAGDLGEEDEEDPDAEEDEMWAVPQATGLPSGVMDGSATANDPSEEEDREQDERPDWVGDASPEETRRAFEGGGGLEQEQAEEDPISAEGDEETVEIADATSEDGNGGPADFEEPPAWMAAENDGQKSQDEQEGDGPEETERETQEEAGQEPVTVAKPEGNGGAETPEEETGGGWEEELGLDEEPETEGKRKQGEDDA